MPVHDEPEGTPAYSRAPAPDGEQLQGGPITTDTAPLCVGRDPNIWFPSHYAGGRDEVRLAKAYCNLCPIKAACLELALEAEGGRHPRDRYGIFGGKTPNERAKADPERRKRGHPAVAGCNGFPARGRGVERHRARGEELCAPCREYELTRIARLRRDAQAWQMNADGKTVGDIALALGERRDTVRRILARQTDLEQSA